MAIVGAVRTVRFAVLLTAPAVGVCVVVIPEVMFGWTPGTLLVTAKLTVHEPAVGITIPVKLKAVAPAANAPGVVPKHVPTTNPPAALILTSVSVKAPPDRRVAFELLNVSVTIEVPPD